MMDTATRKLVRHRAGERCEYCHIHQDQEPFYRFHIEHIIPRQHHGGDSESNLALACYHCNAHKGPNLSAIDPVGNGVVLIFNPRLNAWDEHFRTEGDAIIGLTSVGRATAQLLQMNAPQRLELRAALRGE